METRERLTHKRANGIKEGYWTDCKKDELTQRLGEYEDAELSPAEILVMKKKGNPDSSKFDQFLKELREALATEIRHGMRSYTSKICFIAEVLTVTADQPVELTFTASEIKKAFNVANEKSA